jgi:YD repeat-containing protein
LTVTDAAGQTTTYTYNAAGQVATLTNPLGQTTTMAYSPQGYLSSVTGAVAGSTTTFAYDAYGRVRTVTGPDGNSTTTDYDDLNRPTQVTYSDGTYEQMVYDRLDLARSRDRKGRWTFMTYNPLRQLSEVEDAQGRVTRFDWCSCGSQLEGLTDPMGRVTTWVRDLNGKVVAKVLDDHTRTAYTYDSAGRLAQRIDAKGQLTQYDYFADGALKQVSYPNAQKATPTVSYTYDGKYSRLATMTDGIGTTQYGYWPIATPPSLGAGRLATVDGPWANDTITYQYDALGRVVSRDIAGSAETRVYDLLGRVAYVTNALGAFTYTYDGLTSRLKQVDYPNGQKTKYTYDGPEFRLKSIENLKSDNSNISTFGYTYDLDGQIKTWSQAADAAAPRTYTFDYDAVNQLTGAVLNGPNGELLRQYAYGYDLMGNRTSEGVDGATTTATFNNTNQLQGQRYSLNTAAIRQQEEARKAQKAKAEVPKAKTAKTPASPAPATNR